ncbi:MAG: hypothetical protein Q4F00_04965 [bacterium]|nr:hypothetical protein [bacterium]
MRFPKTFPNTGEGLSAKSWRCWKAASCCAVGLGPLVKGERGVNMAADSPDCISSAGEPDLIKAERRCVAPVCP